MAEEKKKTEVKPAPAANTATVDTSAVNNATSMPSQPKDSANTSNAHSTPSSVPPLFNVSEAEEKFNTRVGSRVVEHDVKAYKRVDATDEKNPIIIEQVEHTADGKKSHTHDTTITIDTYSAVHGHETKTTTSSKDYTYYDKDKTKVKKTIESGITDTLDARDGEFDVVSGQTVAFNDRKEKVTTTTYNKDDSIETMAVHEAVSGRNASLADSYKEYTDYEKGILKREMHTKATAARLAITALENTKKNEIKSEFSATIEADGKAHYLKTTKRKNIDIKIKDGIASGVVQKLDKSGNVAIDERSLSQKQLKKELKGMRKEADAAIAKVSTAKTAEEYMASIPSPLQVGRRDLAYIFTTNTEAAHQQVEPEIMSRHQQIFSKKASISAEQLLQMKKQQIQQK